MFELLHHGRGVNLQLVENIAHQAKELQALVLRRHAVVRAVVAELHRLQQLPKQCVRRSFIAAHDNPGELPHVALDDLYQEKGVPSAPLHHKFLHLGSVGLTKGVTR